MPTTSNFGWTTPADTDLVKDGASAIRTLGNGIDTSMAELKGGTTGQILSKTSNTDMDFTWINNDQGDITAVTAGTGISGGGTSGAVTITNDMATTIDAKGDLIAGTGADAYARLAVGTNGQVLTADSTTATGLKWSSLSTNFVGAKAYRSTNLSVTGGTPTAITYPSEEFDTDSFHSTSTNTSRMTVPSGKAGKYLITGSASLDGATSNYGEIRIYKNGSALGNGLVAGITNRVATGVYGFLASTVVDAAVGDYFELFFLSSANTLNVTNSEFSFCYLGA
jgi:hypothetical protein